ncbi:TolC family protein [Pajaroellobacter abortibovis]|uniref:Transporter n=1 Tax=Pajaroellobacter abortibovis TaxID=1882918 RepID=A0A1L6MV16_9BACT|nr:TolC family protein [Pajaroellobacter abortibovis]APR99360.1 hypothetical protein BCY86_00705 [Pajaroellobacter abortibovis]
MFLSLRSSSQKTVWSWAGIGLFVLSAHSIWAEGPPLAAVAPPLHQPLQLSSPLTLNQGLQLFRARAFDLRLADAQVQVAQGDRRAAAAVANPSFSVQAGPTFNYNPNVEGCSGCQPYAVQWDASDNGAFHSWLSGKRGLRIRSAEAALGAAKWNRVDVQRVLEARFKIQYTQVAWAKAALDFSREQQSSLVQTVKLYRARFPGVMDEGALARIELQKLESDQAVTTAWMNYRQAQLGLGFLLGMQGEQQKIEVEQDMLTFRPIRSLQSVSESDLITRALTHRPDLQSIGWERARALSELELAKRERIPDIALITQYSQLGQGQNGGQPMSISFGISLELPAFYQQQGDIQRARADVKTQELSQAKIVSQVVAEVTSAWSVYRTACELVERMKSEILTRAKVIRDNVHYQVTKGIAELALIDFLDAERTYIATHMDYLNQVMAYWTAVYQLEQAIGEELNE